MKQKLLYFFCGVLIACFPLMNIFFKVFRGVSVSFAHFFEKRAPFPFHIPPLFQKYIHFYLTDFLIVALLIAALFLKEFRLKELLFNRHSKYLTLYVGAALLSISLSLFSSYFTQYISILNLLIAFMGFHLVYLLLQKRSDLIRPIFWAFICVAILESFIGIGQFLYQQSLGLTFLSEPQVTPYMYNIASYPLNEKSRAFFNLLPWIPDDHHLILRSLGTFDHPNIFGGYLTIALFIAYALLMTTQKRRYRALLLVAIPLFILTLGLTFSRGPIFAWLVGTLLFIIAGWLRWETFASHEKKGLMLLSIIVGIGCIASLGLLFEQFLSRGGFFNYNALAASSDSSRIVLYKVALTLFKTHPILGIGFNGYPLFPYGLLDPTFEGANEIGAHAHNIYLQIASETGLVGLVFFGLFLYSLFRLVRKSKATPITLALGAIVASFLLLGLVDHYLWTYNSGRMMFFLFTALFASALSSVPQMTGNSLEIKRL